MFLLMAFWLGLARRTHHHRPKRHQGSVSDVGDELLYSLYLNKNCPMDYRYGKDYRTLAEAIHGCTADPGCGYVYDHGCDGGGGQYGITKCSAKFAPNELWSYHNDCSYKKPVTPSPTTARTKSPTHEPTPAPTPEPTRTPTKFPTKKPTHAPTEHVYLYDVCSCRDPYVSNMIDCHSGHSFACPDETPVCDNTDVFDADNFATPKGWDHQKYGQKSLNAKFGYDRRESIKTSCAVEADIQCHCKIKGGRAPGNNQIKCTDKNIHVWCAADQACFQDTSVMVPYAKKSMLCKR